MSDIRKPKQEPKPEAGRNLYNMEEGDILTIKNYEVLRVPGGWAYTRVKWGVGGRLVRRMWLRSRRM
jgi:hypothetical protein